jgi:multiple sugar transport system substrate-binding protein
MASKRIVSRRGLLLAMAATAGGALLAACTPAEPKVVKEPQIIKETVQVEVTVAPRQKVTIEWWWCWGGINGLEGLKAMSEAFNAQSDMIAVKSLVPGGDISQKYTVAVAAGNPPDLGVGVHGAFSELAARGGLMPLDEWLHASTVIDMADFFEGLWEASTWMGKIYGVQCAENGPRMGLMYNIDLVEGAGLDPEKPPQTWDEVYEWHTAITKFDKAGNVEIVGLDPLDAMGGRYATADADFLWTGSFGVKWWDQPNLGFAFDQEGFIQSLATIQKFYDFVGVTKMEGFRASYGTWTASPQASFPAGVEGMILDGYWSPPWMQTNGPDVRFLVTWAPVPGARRGVRFQNVGGHQGNIPVGAKHPQEAFKLMEFLTTDVCADINWAKTGFFSARKSWVEKNSERIVSEIPQMEFFIRSMFEADEMWPSPLCPIAGFVGSEWRKAIDAVNYGRKPAAQAASDLQAAVTAEIDKQKPGFVM